MILRVDFEWLTIVSFLCLLIVVILMAACLKWYNTRLKELEDAVWSK